jgi:class 3 adenylate cyclase
MLDLEGVVDSLSLRRFGLLGMSQSGPVAIAFAARHPERVSHLVLLGGSARGEDFFRSEQDRALWQLAAADWHLYTELAAFMFVGWSAGEDGGRYAAALRESATLEAARASRDATAGFDVTDLLGQVRSPTLVVHHRASQVVGVDAARRLAAGILNARLVVLEGGGLQENPEETAKTVLAFLSEGNAASAPAKDLQAASVVTILFTDLTSSTALTQRLGDAKAQELVRAHNAIVREALAAHGGTEIKHTGDGIMASFGSASGALECAVAIQRAVAERGESNLAVHIGLNAGEPVAEEQDLFGTSVQLARRICDQAEGGEILASDVVRQLAAGKGFLFADRGEVALRGFEDPVRLSEVRWRPD